MVGVNAPRLELPLTREDAIIWTGVIWRFELPSLLGLMSKWGDRQDAELMRNVQWVRFILDERRAVRVPDIVYPLGWIWAGGDLP